ncbi:MAG: hypothetical protein H6912_02855 [Kordiimonadaceae bacterium]|nr:hypothetical protein [Kordiimonadaceae bacterium]
MRNALIISGIFHAAFLIIAAMDIALFDSVEDSEMVVIPVEILPFDEETKTMEIAKLPEPQKEKPEPPKKLPERQAELPPPPPKMQSSMPLPEEAKKPAVKPKPPEKKPEPPQVAQRSKPKPPSRYDADRIAQLLNKVPEQENITDRLAEKFGQQEQKATSLDVQRQTMSISAAIQKKIEEQCWNPPSGALDAGSLRVKVYMYLTLDGNLARPPVADDYVRMSGAMKVAADSALRAVRMCAPYSDLKLPKTMYDQWREVILNFDPSGMIS